MNYCSQVSRLDKYTQKRDPFSTELLNAVKTEQQQQQKKEKHVDYWKEKKKNSCGMLVFFVKWDVKTFIYLHNLWHTKELNSELFSSAADVIQ